MNSPAKYYERIQFAQKSIRIRKQSPESAEAIRKKFEISLVASRVLAARGYQADDRLKNFLQPSLREGLPNPKGLKNLDKACDLIKETVASGKSIAICCDFDVDGLSGGAQLHHFFNKIGAENQVFVPDRFEDGYGLNEKMVRKIAKSGFALLISVDYGTTNVKELTLAGSLGLKTIVLDHHHVAAVPPADIFVNPNQEGCSFADRVMSASGLAWYMIVALKNCLAGDKVPDPRSYLDLACLGTICDMVPLIGVNRVIAKRGLELASNSKREGLVALKNMIGIYRDVSCTDVSFGIGPRLNAAGRMVHGEVVIDLLTTSDPDKAKKIAQKLNKLNAERQEAEGIVKEKAIQDIQKRGCLPWGIVVSDPEFHTGVVGIVAQRLVESFYRPSVVLGMDSDGLYKGSVRGIKGFNVVESLHAAGEYLVKFGGHEGAGGLSLKKEKLADFTECYEKICEQMLSGLDKDPYVEADTEVTLEELRLELVQELKSFAPFGMGNPNPVLLTKGLKVKEVKVLKGAHTKATFTDGKNILTGLLWRQASHPYLVPGCAVNIAYRPDTNTFNSLTELQASLQAIEKV